jgi:3-deoxy-7-phosphoheptulonate synthase
MSFEYVQRIPAVDSILAEMPLDDNAQKIKHERDRLIRDIFTRESKKFLVVIGPCSADNEEAVCEYALRLSKVQERVKDCLVLVPRVYTNKPRTTGEGYKGMAHQPIPTKEPDIVVGLKAIRKMHLRILREARLTAADEMLYPGNYPYLSDILGYVAIGARSVENQEHRLTVSGLDVPAGMKNPTSGDLNVMLNSIQAAQMPHTFIYHDWEVKTQGNPLAHAILRGATGPDGKSIPNYHYEDMARLAEMYLSRSLKNPTLIIDTNHANSGKRFAEQLRIAMEVIESMERSETLRRLVRGLMIESYLVEGAQDVSEGTFGKSITDSCLGWEDSHRLLLDIAERVSKL